jgi:hypothetical protein
MTQVGSLRMCLDPDVVPPLAGFLLVAVLGVLHHILSVFSVCFFKTAHCFRSFYIPRDRVPDFQVNRCHFVTCVSAWLGAKLLPHIVSHA